MRLKKTFAISLLTGAELVRAAAAFAQTQPDNYGRPNWIECMAIKSAINACKNRGITDDECKGGAAKIREAGMDKARVWIKDCLRRDYGIPRNWEDIIHKNLSLIP